MEVGDMTVGKMEVGDMTVGKMEVGDMTGRQNGSRRYDSRPFAILHLHNL
jgi:hypothetical protein